MPCMCGATDCPSCGPAQDYPLIRVYDHDIGGYIWINPEEKECDEDDEVE